MNTENNKIIAEFMGMKPINKNEPDGIYNCTVKAHGYNIVQHFTFHSDWNWLMEVVEKINTMDEWQFSLHIYFSRVTIYDNLNKKWILEDFQGTDTLPTVYNACVEFIKWYNLNK